MKLKNVLIEVNKRTAEENVTFLPLQTGYYLLRTDFPTDWRIHAIIWHVRREIVQSLKLQKPLMGDPYCETSHGWQVSWRFVLVWRELSRER